MQSIQNAVGTELEKSITDFTEYAIIKKIGPKKWCVFSESGKNLGCYPSLKRARERLKQIEQFKHMKSGMEVGSYDCYCSECGTYFISLKRCDQSKCPVCKEQDSIFEITGEY
jgi:rubrerythrin